MGGRRREAARRRTQIPSRFRRRGPAKSSREQPIPTEDLAAAEHRCATPEPLPVLCLPDADEDSLQEASPESGEEEDPVVTPIPTDGRDITFVCEGGVEIKARKLILETASDYFLKMFQSETREPL